MDSQELSELQEGLDHLSNRRWDAAIVSLRVAISREPGRFAAVRALSTAYVQSGAIAEARQIASDFTLNFPMCDEGWRLAAQLEWKLNNTQAALDALKRGLDHLPNSPILHRQIALFQGAKGQLETSLKHLSHLPSTHQPNPIETYVAAAVGQSTPAQSPFFPTQTSELRPTEPDWLDRLAQDPKLLDTLLKTADDTQSDIVMLRTLEAKLVSLLKSQPHHADRHVMLARLQLKIGDPIAAMHSANRALRANPNFTSAHRIKAEIHAHQEEYQTAIQILQTLINQGLDYADIHFQIAQWQQQSGHATEARNHLYNAIRLNPNFDQAKQLLERCAA